MNKKNLILTVAVVCVCLSGCAKRQNIIVIPSEHNASKATVELYENDKKKLQFEALIGRNGVAKIGDKKEGDGKTPAGKYSILTLFGNVQGVWNMPFVKTSTTLYCVDDSKSKNYNQIIDSDKTVKDYDSFEYMLRSDGQYDIGAVIGYNENNEPQKGSCIFIHIQKSNNSPTAGCVALKREDAFLLFESLDKAKRPTIEIRER